LIKHGCLLRLAFWDRHAILIDFSFELVINSWAVLVTQFSIDVKLGLALRIYFLVLDATGP
jgi:hypothetical protein